jgi:predicted unusual protein kinase regulating ubiquinone biosynthesis (AarF/ABC1/UbiB family)
MTLTPHRSSPVRSRSSARSSRRTWRALGLGGAFVGIVTTAGFGALRRRDAGGRLGRSRLGRNARLVRMGAKVGSTYASTAARKTFASSERRHELDREREFRTAEQVATELGQMKGALMKLGQMASYIDDGLPEPLRLALAQLQQDAPPMSTGLARSTIEAELGASIEQLFVEFDDEPIAAASIGQVHRAIIRDEQGEERAVAVKVQYPGIGTAIASDLRNADILGVLLKQSFGGLDPSEMVDEIKTRLADEVDYELEATNQTLFAEYYRGHPFIRIPAVVESHSTQRILTTELAHGHRWSDMMLGDQETRDRVGEIIFRFVFRSLYRFGAFNGDPHPGNYLFHDDGSVTFLDFGLVKHFTPDELRVFSSMVKAAAVDHDHEEFRRIVEEAGMLRHDAGVETEAVAEYFSLFYDAVRTDAEMTWTREYANSVVRHTFDRSSPISQYATVPRAFVFIQRINLGLYALLGELGATGNYRRIASELWPFVDSEPGTELGRAEAAWLRTVDPSGIRHPMDPSGRDPVGGAAPSGPDHF